MNAMPFKRFLVRFGWWATFMSAAVVEGTAAVEFSVDWDGEDACIEEFPVRASLRWAVDDSSIAGVEVRVGDPDGTLFSRGGRIGFSETGQWVFESMEFFLLSRPRGELLANASLDIPSCEALRIAERRERMLQLLETAGDELVKFELSPPRLFYCGQPIERTAVRLRWDVSEFEVSKVEIYIDSTAGTLFGKGPESGEAVTRNWVTDGMVFVLYLPEYDEVAALREFRIRPCAEINESEFAGQKQ